MIKHRRAVQVLPGHVGRVPVAKRFTLRDEMQRQVAVSIFRVCLDPLTEVADYENELINSS